MKYNANLIGAIAVILAVFVLLTGCTSTSFKYSCPDGQRLIGTPTDRTHSTDINSVYATDIEINCV